MAINVTLLDRTMAHIEAHPEDWHQAVYRCGTRACVAGHAAILDGGQWVNGYTSDLVAREDDPAEDVYDGEIGVHDRAQRILGLTDGQADELFDANNTMDDLRRIVADLKAQAAAEAVISGTLHTSGGAR